MTTVPAPTGSPTRPFGARDKIGYLFGDWGNDLTFIFASAYLMVFYTNVAGLKPAHVGTLFLVARLVDAFTDVGWGHALDRMRPSAAGRFRPWILRMAIPVAVASSLMYFFGIADWSYGAKLSYAAVTYLVWGSVFYTSVNIPYGSMASVITSDPGQRSELSVFRAFGASLAALLVTGVPPLFLYHTVDGQSQAVPDRFFWGAIAFGVGAIVCYTLCYRLTTERVQVRRRDDDAASARPRRSFGALMVALFSNRALVVLIVSNIVLFLAAMMVNTMMPYVWLYHFNDGQMSSWNGILSQVPIIALTPVAAAAAKKIGKKELIGTSICVTGVLYLAVWVLHVSNPWVYLALTFVASFGVALYTMLVWAMVTDVMDDEELRSGERDDGTIYAMNTWARKLSQAAAGGLGGWALGWVGFQAGASQQAQSTVDGIFNLGTLVPGLLYVVVGVFLLLAYPLSRSRVEANTAALATHRHGPAHEG